MRQKQSAAGRLKHCSGSHTVHHPRSRISSLFFILSPGSLLIPQVARKLMALDCCLQQFLETASCGKNVGQ